MFKGVASRCMLSNCLFQFSIHLNRKGTDPNLGDPSAEAARGMVSCPPQVHLYSLGNLSKTIIL